MEKCRVNYLGIGLLALAMGLVPFVADAKEKVKVGFIAPLSGKVSSNGLGGRNSADLAIRLRNADPKAKYEYEMVAQDSECQPSTGVQVATKLAANKEIVAAVTHYCSAVAMAVVDIYHRFQLPVVVWSAVLPDITYGNDYAEVHRVNGTMVNQNEFAVKFMRELGYKKWVIFHDTTDYGHGHNKYFTQYLEENGGQILDRIGLPFEQQDITAELTRVKPLDADVLYFGGLTDLGVRVRRQMEKQGLEMQFQGTSGIVSEAFIKGAGNELAEGVVAFREGAPTEKLPGGKFFLEKYAEVGYDHPPEAYGAYGFAAMNLVLDAIEAVGPDRKKVRDLLDKTKDRDSIVGKITFDEHGQNIIPLITPYVIQDGKWTPWEDSEYASGKRKLVPPISGQ